MEKPQGSTVPRVLEQGRTSAALGLEGWRREQMLARREGKGFVFQGPPGKCRDLQKLIQPTRRLQREKA